MADNSKSLRAFAQSIRVEPVAIDRMLWNLLRGRRLEGLEFRRQVPLGNYLVEFICLRHRLIVEAKDPFQKENGAYDLGRDSWLRGQGFQVLRIPYTLIAHDPPAVLTMIVDAMRPLAEKLPG